MLVLIRGKYKTVKTIKGQRSTYLYEKYFQKEINFLIKTCTFAPPLPHSPSFSVTYSSITGSKSVNGRITNLDKRFKNYILYFLKSFNNTTKQSIKFIALLIFNHI